MEHIPHGYFENVTWNKYIKYQNQKYFISLSDDFVKTLTFHEQFYIKGINDKKVYYF